MAHLKVFGCKAYPMLQEDAQKPGAFNPRGLVGAYLESSTRHLDAYQVWLPSRRQKGEIRLFRSWRIHFDENAFWNFKILDLEIRREAVNTSAATDISSVTYSDAEDLSSPAITTAAKGIHVASLSLQAGLLVKRRRPTKPNILNGRRRSSSRISNLLAITTTCFIQPQIHG